MMRKDRIKNESIRGTAQVGCYGDKVKETEVVWTCVEEIDVGGNR